MEITSQMIEMASPVMDSNEDSIALVVFLNLIMGRHQMEGWFTK
jgi:hypothetical protein